MKKYKISEISNLFKISRETLLYYDKMNILKPNYVDESNGYRYYNENSITQLSFILNLKESSFSLKEIKEYLEADQNIKSLSILEEKLNKIDEQIIKLNLSRKVILSEIEEINLINSKKENTPFISQLENMNTYLIPVNKPKDEYELQKSLVILKNFKKKYNLVNISRVAILKQETFFKGKFLEVDKVGYIFKNNSKKNRNLITDEFKIGKCICIYHNDETSKIGLSYNKLLNYINKNNYEISGDSIEIFDELVVNNGKRKGRIIKICIPIH